MANVLKFSDDLARLFCHFHGEVCRALTLPTIATLLAHLFQRSNSPLITGSARLDTLANPLLLFRETLVEQRIRPLFGGQQSFAVHEKTAVVSIPRYELASIKLNNFVRNLTEKCAVMGNQQQGASE